MGLCRSRRRVDFVRPDDQPESKVELGVVEEFVVAFLPAARRKVMPKALHRLLDMDRVGERR
jgi:hypothetical protein